MDNIYASVSTARSSSIKVHNDDKPKVNRTYGDNTAEVKVIKYDGRGNLSNTNVNLDSKDFASSITSELRKQYKWGN